MTQQVNHNGRLMAELELITRDWRDGNLSDVTAVGKVLTTISQSPLPSPIEIEQVREQVLNNES